MNNDLNNKIVIATRATENEYEMCVDRVNGLIQNKYISKCFIISDKKNCPSSTDKIINIFDKKPNRATSFNLVLKKMRDGSDKYHLLTYSKEVELTKVYIEKMLEEIEKKKNIEKLIVVGFKFKDNVTSDLEYTRYSKGESFDDGIAYKIPWSTCALWNKTYVYGSGNKELYFDSICEDNYFDNLFVNIYDHWVITKYEGMEDGLAIAKIINNNKDAKFKLFEEYLFWKLPDDEKRRFKHKIKLARKNIVLSKFMNINGYSIDKLREVAMND